MIFNSMETNKMNNLRIGYNLRDAILSEDKANILMEVDKLAGLGFGRREIYKLIRAINLDRKSVV